MWLINGLEFIDLNLFVVAFYFFLSDPVDKYYDKRSVFTKYQKYEIQVMILLTFFR